MSPEHMPILIFFNHGMPKARFPFFLPIDLTRKLRNIEIVSRKYFQDIFSDDSVFALFLGASFMTIYGLIYLFLTFIAYKCKHSLFKKQ